MKDVTNFMFIAQDVEFLRLIILFKSASSNKTIGLGGNGQFFRLSMITEHSGYQPWGNALLMTMELTIKLMLKELSIAYIDEALWPSRSTERCETFYSSTKLGSRKFRLSSVFTQGD